MLQLSLAKTTLATCPRSSTTKPSEAVAISGLPKLRPRRKNVKESADLKESRMSLEDRLAFIEGKKAELASIFENQVWEIELHPEKVDWNRVMKARFVLKWSADNNGKPTRKSTFGSSRIF